MKALIPILLIFVSSIAMALPFKYHDRVRVKSGFYEGCQGVVTFEIKNGSEYTVDLNRDRNGLEMFASESFKAENLESMKEFESISVGK